MDGRAFASTSIAGGAPKHFRFQTSRITPIAALIVRVSFEMGVPREAIVGRSTCQREVRARAAIAWLARRLTTKTLAQIGVALGGRDHSTLTNLVAKAEGLRDRDPAFRLLTDRLLGDNA